MPTKKKVSTMRRSFLNTPSEQRAMIDLIRSIMYSGEDGTNDAGNNGSLMIAEVEVLAKALGKYDGVPYNKKMKASNRLVLALKFFKDTSPNLFQDVERLNDE